MKKKHKRCANPGCRNIVPYGSKKGTICGICKRRLEAEKPLSEQELEEIRETDEAIAKRLKILKEEA
jgi:hypothetical protein